MSDEPEQMERRGGPRPKVRPDDQRGLGAVNVAGGLLNQSPYIPNDDDRKLVSEYAVVVGRKLLAKRIGVSQSTLERHYGKELNEALFKAAAINGGRIWKRATEGDAGAQYFFQRMRGGWTDRESPYNGEFVDDSGDHPNSFAVPPEVLAELSDEEFELYERLCERLLRLGNSGSAEPAAGPALPDRRAPDPDAGEDEA